MSLDQILMNSPVHNRRSVRLEEYDYSQQGAYFVTICTQQRECLLGQVMNTEMEINEAGKMVQSIWHNLSIRYPYSVMDEFIVMPNHIHGIIFLQELGRGDPCDRPENVGTYDREDLGEYKIRPYGTLPKTLGRIIQGFKSMTTHQYILGVKKQNWPSFPGKLWQRNYYEHVIRSEEDLNQVREYIQNNPLNWAFDPENFPHPTSG